MAKRTWRLAARTAKPTITVPDEIKSEVSSKAEQVLLALTRRLKARKKQNTLFNTPVEVTAHWDRNAFYFSVTYESRGPKAAGSNFRTNVARIEYNADGTFNLGFPMRRGWTATLRNVSLNECMETVTDGVYF